MTSYITNLRRKEKKENEIASLLDIAASCDERKENALRMAKEVYERYMAWCIENEIKPKEYIIS